MPLIRAAYGMASALLALAAGAAAVRVGTVLPRADEAGTPVPYRAALLTRHAVRP